MFLNPAMQRYVSNELTHFVARSQPSNEHRYRVLSSILASGTLLAAPADGSPDPGRGWLRHGESPLCEDRYKTGVVCFCDIPVPDLGM